LYMAPEQMRGEALDGRVDQFSWAVLAYELLCGELPWGAGVDKLQLVANLMSKEAAPLSERDPAIPEHVSRAVQRALSKAPGARFLSMGAALAAFEQRAESAPSADVASPPSSPLAGTLGAPSSALRAEPRAMRTPSAASMVRTPLPLERVAA